MARQRQCGCDLFDAQKDAEEMVIWNVECSGSVMVICYIRDRNGGDI